MQPVTYEVTIDGQSWTVTQDASGRIFAAGPGQDSEPVYFGSWTLPACSQINFESRSRVRT